MVGERIWNKEHTNSGIITKESRAYCPICKTTHPCYIVKWDNGKTTKPRQSMVMRNIEGILEVQK